MEFYLMGSLASVIVYSMHSKAKGYEFTKVVASFIMIFGWIFFILLTAEAINERLKNGLL